MTKPGRASKDRKLRNGGWVALRHLFPQSAECRPASGPQTAGGEESHQRAAAPRLLLSS